MASTRSVTVLLLALIFVLLCLAPAFAEGNDCNDPRSGDRLHKRLGLHRHGDKGKYKHHGRPSDEPEHKHAKPCADGNVDVRGPHRGLKSIDDECREEPQHRGDCHDEHPVGHSADPCDDTLQDRPKYHREHEKRADLSDPCDETRGVGSEKHTDKHSRLRDKQQHHPEGESRRDLGGRGQSEQPGRGEQRGPRRGLKSIEEKRPHHDDRRGALEGAEPCDDAPQRAGPHHNNRVYKSGHHIARDAPCDDAVVGGDRGHGKRSDRSERVNRRDRDPHREDEPCDDKRP